MRRVLHLHDRVPNTWYPTQEAKRARLTVMLAYAGSAIELLWSAAFVVAGSSYSGYWRGVAWNGMASVSFMLVPLLNRRAGLRMFARLALIALGNFWIFMLAALYLGKNGTQYCFLPMTSLPFVIFDTRNRVSTFFGVLLPLVLFITLELGHFGFFPEAFYLASTPWTYWMTVGTAFAMSFLVVYSFRRANEKFERVLRESQGRFLRVVEAAQEGIVVCDDNGKISYANPGFAQLLGVPAGKLVGRSIMDFVSPPCREHILKHVLGLKREEVRFVRPDGKERVAWMSTSPLYEDRPESTAHVGLILDLTEVREKERLIEQQRGQMLSSAKLSALGEMAAGIAHEIYNPLTSLRLSAGILVRFLSGEDRDHRRAFAVADQMEATIARIVHIIEGLKAFSREDRTAEPVDVPLAEVIDNTLSLCRERFRARGIELSAPVPARELAVHVRPIQISQVLLNLLNNSFDAVASQGERRVTVECRTFPSGQYVEVSVTDSGPGIPDEIRDRIFQPFFTTKPPGVGTGLGLSISKGIIESHGGRLSFRSEPGRTSFRFTVPLAQMGTRAGRAA